LTKHYTNQQRTIVKKTEKKGMCDMNMLVGAVLEHLNERYDVIYYHETRLPSDRSITVGPSTRIGVAYSRVAAFRCALEFMADLFDRIRPPNSPVRLVDCTRPNYWSESRMSIEGLPPRLRGYVQFQTHSITLFYAWQLSPTGREKRVRHVVEIKQVDTICSPTLPESACETMLSLQPGRKRKQTEKK
jgi:hypothetical protein